MSSFRSVIGKLITGVTSTEFHVSSDMLGLLGGYSMATLYFFREPKTPTSDLYSYIVDDFHCISKATRTCQLIIQHRYYSFDTIEWGVWVIHVYEREEFGDNVSSHAGCRIG